MPIQTFNPFPKAIPDSSLGVGIKSFQKGSGSLSATSVVIPISRVDSTKSIVTVSFKSSSSNGSGGYSASNMVVSAELTSDTSITLRKDGTGAISDYTWSVIEFSALKSLQRGSVVTATLNTDIPISTVNPAKCLLFISFSAASSSTDNSTIFWSVFSQWDLTSPNNLRITYVGPGNTVKWQVVELF